MIVSEQLNYIKTRRFHAVFMPVLIEFSRCIGTYSSAKFEIIKQFNIVRNAERTPVSNYDVALIFDFDTVETLDEYQKSRLHMEFGEFVYSIRVERACIDFEI